ncbi:MAG: type II toxin-antitoxin system RelE/ParE family toxin [Firmicutes bacterium]|nr:type II toxin-antitoxin system RelE/ParE family toxin [Bacillota bacterium]
MWQIEYYEKENGEKPVKVFINQELDIKLKAEAIALLERLEQEGNNIRLPYSDYLEDGILELRIKHSSNIARILYFFQVGKKIILTNGFIKKTQKTPRKEIEKAKKYRDDYIRRLKV